MPGIFKSGDIDLVIEPAVQAAGSRERLNPVFESLRFSHEGRHWRRDKLFVEVPSLRLDDPSELVRVGSFMLRVLSKEVLLVERVVGFKQWKQTAYGQQAVDMIAAFGNDLDLDVLTVRLKREGSLDAYEALRMMAEGSEPVTEASLRQLLKQLTG